MKIISTGVRIDQVNGNASNVGVKEEDFLSQIIDLAHIYHWRIAHFRPAWTQKGWRTAVSGDGKGFPDCVLVKPPRIIFAELKSEKGIVTPAQREWLDTLALLPRVEVYVWRPGDFDGVAKTLGGNTANAQ